MALLRVLILSMAVTYALAGCAKTSPEAGFDERVQEELEAALAEALGGGSLYSERPSNVSLSQYTVQIALQVVAALHKDHHTSADVVRAGFAKLANRHPDFSFIVENPDIVISNKGDEVYRFLRPPDTSHALWAESVNESIKAFIDKRSVSAGPNHTSLLDDFLSGMANSLDRFATYYAHEYVVQRQRYLASELARVGIGIEPVQSGAVVLSLSDFGILDGGFLKRDDVIVSVDGRPLAGLDRSTIEGNLYGPLGSTATLDVLRNGQSAAQSVAIERQKVNGLSVRTKSIGSLLHVQIINLNRRTGVQLTDALTKASTTGDQGPKGVVLDLRGNPGGFLSSSTAIADVFLADGEIVSTLGRKQANNETIRARENAPTNWLPLVLLTSGNSGGGAEIIASALQDLERAVVVGEVSYGDGLIQTGRRLPNGGDLFFTSVEAVTPAGYRLDKRGVMPTVCTGGDVTAEAVLAELRAGGGTIGYATRTRDIDPEDAASVAAFRALCPPRSDGADIDLEVARAILEAPALYADILARDRQSKQAAVQ
jgi:carboxyl-terminal processing protease